jgi:hypothetical protein
MMALAKPTIFISYKRGHDLSLAFIGELEAALVDGHQVLRDVNIEGGKPWSDELWHWLMGCSGAIVLINGEAAESEWCRREWSVLAARVSQTGLRVVPVHIGAVGRVAHPLDHLQGVTAGPGAVERVVELLRDLPAEPMQSADYLAAHTAWVRRLFVESPALGREPFSLADVYIETECGGNNYVTIVQSIRSQRTVAGALTCSKRCSTISVIPIFGIWSLCMVRPAAASRRSPSASPTDWQTMVSFRF